MPRISIFRNMDNCNYGVYSVRASFTFSILLSWYYQSPSRLAQNSVLWQSFLTPKFELGCGDTGFSSRRFGVNSLSIEFGGRLPAADQGAGCTLSSHRGREEERHTRTKGGGQRESVLTAKLWVCLVCCTSAYLEERERASSALLYPRKPRHMEP